MKHLTLSCGFETDIDETVFQDIRLFEDIRALEQGQAMALLSVIDRILGDGKEALYECLKDENGRTTITAVSDAVTEIIKAASPKNSPSSSPSVPGRKT